MIRPAQRSCFRRGAHHAALVLLAACLQPTGVTVDSDVARFRVDGGAIVITNTSQAPVYYFAADRDALAVLDWAPCDDPATCNGIAPGASRRLPFASLAGYQPGTKEASIHHWHLVPGNRASGFIPDRVRQSIVPLH